MVRSGYVLAGFETLATIMDNFIAGRRGRFNDNFTRAEVSNFLANIGSGYLHSYGQDFPGKKKYNKYNEKETNLFKICRDMRIFDNCDLIADSGGFQISTGKLTRRESELLYKMYYDWVQESYEYYDKAFILDIPPGPGCEIFHNFYDVYKLNLESYQLAQSLPDHVREKIIYIHHFRTPKLWEIYTKILRDYEMFPSFKYHGCGGIVANMASDMSIPCIIYVLPIIPLINECKTHGRDFLNFHVLGGANFRDVLYYELFKLAVKKYHNIELNLTYDSSGVYKQVMHARFLLVEDGNGHIRKMNLKQDALHHRFFFDEPTMVTYERVLNEMAVKHGFKPIQIDGVYSEETGTFHEDVKVYSILYTLNNYSKVQEQMREFANRVFDMHENGLEREFNDECLEMTRKINQGKLTKKAKIKAYCISRSLDMLKNLDEDYCKYLVDKFLSKDEFVELDETKRILSF